MVNKILKAYYLKLILFRIYSLAVSVGNYCNWYRLIHYTLSVVYYKSRKQNYKCTISN